MKLLTVLKFLTPGFTQDTAIVVLHTMGVASRFKVERRGVCVCGVYLKDDVLVAIAISATKRIDTVCGGRPVQYNRLVRRMSQVFVHFTPLGRLDKNIHDHTRKAAQTLTHTSLIMSHMVIYRGDPVVHY